jgi:hypothetical protein
MRIRRFSFPLACLLAIVLHPAANASGFLVAGTYTTGSLPSAAVVQDFNHDGFADIATANRNNKNISVLLGKADGTFGNATNYPVSAGPFEIAAGDLNGDGNADLAVTDDFGAVNVFLGNGDGTFGAPSQVTLQYAPEGVRAADLNGDGKLDLAIAIHGADELREGSVAILLGKGNGSFQAPVYYAAGQNPMRLAVADLNADGKPDLAVADENCCATNSLAVLLGKGDGTFRAPLLSTPGVASDIAAGDLNGDGKIDLVLAGEYAGSVRVVFGNGDGTFQAAVNYASPNSTLTTVLADVNADGIPDVLAGSLGGVNVLLGRSDGTFGSAVSYGVGSEFVAVGNFNGDQALDLVAGGRTFIGVAFGRGDGSFRAPRIYPAGTLIRGTAMGDFNGDGNPDLALAKQPPDNTLLILLGTGDGTFTQGAQFSNITPNSVIAADFNGDSKLDLSVSAAGVNIYLGNGDGTFRQPKNSPTGSNPISQAVGDFNHDGHLDLATANGFGNNISVLLGKGDGTFQATVNYAAGDTPTAIVSADFNHDGNLDLAVTNAFGGDLGVYLGNGDGTFQSALTTLAVANELVAADFNRDGKPDLAISGGVTTQVLLGNGDGSFQSPKNVTTAVGILKVTDTNRDGKLDLVVSDFGGLVNVCLGKGDGTFKVAVPYSPGFLLSGWLAIGDLNRDGSPDVMVTDAEDNVSALLNTGGTQITLTSSPNPSKVGQPVTFTATVAASFPDIGTPSGKVTFKDGNTTLGTATLAGGQANFTTSNLSAGTHKITAVYSGDSTFNPNVSPALRQKVNN